MLDHDMIAQIATLVCAAAMALCLSVEAGSFFHSPASTSSDGHASASSDDDSAADERISAT